MNEDLLAALKALQNNQKPDTSIGNSASTSGLSTSSRIDNPSWGLERKTFGLQSVTEGTIIIPDLGNLDENN
ncbi:hypothetical protein [Lacrimispora amygdalina]|uniref:hypothetical protein n=1 Tax=Lacrimispora amygdalina TaxID=253257 RepID=UPI000BE2D709|nr:hypothetical protein [Lacrimispora amygdalina]